MHTPPETEQVDLLAHLAAAVDRARADRTVTLPNAGVVGYLDEIDLPAATPRVIATAPRTHAVVDSFRADRDTAWDKVKRPTSTRWDLTRFEKADKAYRTACHLYNQPYIDIA